MPVLHHLISKPNPEISIVIPSLDGSRKGNVGRLTEQIRQQTRQDFELLLVVNERPNSYARNLGAANAQGRILVFVDDDAILGNNRVIELLVRPFDVDGRVGMSGASTDIPPDSNRFQRWLSRYLPTSSYSIVDEITDTPEGATTLCCAMTRSIWNRIGGANSLLWTGTDNDLRYRVRQAGYRVVLAPGCLAYHPIPASPRAFMQSVFNYGLGAPVYHRECAYLGKQKNFRNGAAAMGYSMVRIVTSIIAAAAALIVLKPNPARFMSGPAFWWGYYRGYSAFLLSGKYEEAKSSLLNGGRGWSDI